MTLHAHFAMVALVVASVACASDAEHTPVTDSAVARPATGVASAPVPDTAPAATPASDSSVTENGLGPLRVGMTLAEARTALGGALLVPRGADTAGCDYVTWRGGPRGVKVMIGDGRIARVDVESVTVPTAAGARVGDTEDRIRSLYPGRVAVSPHKYEEGHYLTVNTAGDSSFAMVFETANGRVTRYRAGRRPAVEYVEGCS
jgi:hypothetical protein